METPPVAAPATAAGPATPQEAPGGAGFAAMLEATVSTSAPDADAPADQPATGPRSDTADGAVEAETMAGLLWAATAPAQAPVTTTEADAAATAGTAKAAPMPDMTATVEVPAASAGPDLAAGAITPDDGAEPAVPLPGDAPRPPDSTRRASTTAPPAAAAVAPAPRDNPESSEAVATAVAASAAIRPAEVQPRAPARSAAGKGEPAVPAATEEGDAAAGAEPARRTAIAEAAMPKTPVPGIDTDQKARFAIASLAEPVKSRPRGPGSSDQPDLPAPGLTAPTDVARPDGPGHAADAPRAAPPAPPVRQLAPMAVALAFAARDGESSSLSLSLDPGELGRVEVSVERHGGHTAIHLSAERPETLVLLQRDQRELERALSQAGIGTEGRSLEFSLSGQGAGQRDGQQGAPTPWRSFAGGNPARAAAGEPPPRIALSLLDIAV